MNKKLKAYFIHVSIVFFAFATLSRIITEVFLLGLFLDFLIYVPCALLSFVVIAKKREKITGLSEDQSENFTLVLFGQFGCVFCLHVAFFTMEKISLAQGAKLNSLKISVTTALAAIIISILLYVFFLRWLLEEKEVDF